MYIGEKKRKPFLAPIVLTVVLGIVGYFGYNHYNTKLSEAHTKGFVEGCANVAAYQKQMTTGHSISSQEAFYIMQGCLQFKEQIENPQPAPQRHYIPKGKTI